MTYQIDWTKQDVSYCAEDGTYLEGDRRVLRDHHEMPDTYDPESGGEGGPVAWAVDVLSKTDACQPSIYPVPAGIGPSAWLSGTYEHPHGDYVQETTARLTGDWTDAQRADVFRAVYRRVFPNG
jgi:hypothetical protein